jgi:SagB-type dehydrogenase family enzyme
MRGRGGARGVRVRRSPHLVAYWRQQTVVACNYATGVNAELPPAAGALLSFCGDWKTLREIEHEGFVAASTLTAVVDRMVSLTLLQRSDRPPDPRVAAMDTLDAWNPQAGFFHATTKDVRFASPKAAARSTLASPRGTRPPAAFKRYSKGTTILLPAPDPRDAFGRVLRARRTWRRYSSRPVTLPELAAVLALSAGVQQWICAEGTEIPFKTSPSGGARHAIECYVIARDVAGLRSGRYHYAPDRHGLTRIGAAVPVERIRAYVPGSEYFAKASAIVFFTAVFERILWRYPFARAYRAALIECGHVCQTFCLTATHLKLAPFSVMALADSLIERDLGIDGIRESVLYAAGVGRPPRGASWAPLAKGRLSARDKPPHRGL